MKVRNKVSGEVLEALDVSALKGEEMIQAIKSWVPTSSLDSSTTAITLAGRAVEGDNAVVRRSSGGMFVLSTHELYRFYDLIEDEPEITIPKEELRSDEISGIARERYYVSPDASEDEVNVATGVQVLAIAIVRSCPGGHDRDAALAHLDDVLARALRSRTAPQIVNEFPVMGSI